MRRSARTSSPCRSWRGDSAARSCRRGAAGSYSSRACCSCCSSRAGCRRRGGLVGSRPAKFGFHHGTYLGLLGHLFLFFTAIDPTWSTPPWPLFAALAVLTLALTATSLAVYSNELHAAGAIAAAIIVFAWARVST